MYGVFDLSGGVWERTAGYVANGYNQLKDYGSSLTDSGTRITSTKYVTVYPHDTAETSTDIDTKSRANYNVNKYIFGDAIRETSASGTGATSWKGDYSYFQALDSPFSVRGAVYGLFHMSGCSISIVIVVLAVTTIASVRYS